jgi:hypothetical protein
LFGDRFGIQLPFSNERRLKLFIVGCYPLIRFPMESVPTDPEDVYQALLRSGGITRIGSLTRSEFIPGPLGDREPDFALWPLSPSEMTASPQQKHAHEHTHRNSVSFP